MSPRAPRDIFPSRGLQAKGMAIAGIPVQFDISSRLFGAPRPDGFQDLDDVQPIVIFGE